MDNTRDILVKLSHENPAIPLPPETPDYALPLEAFYITEETIGYINKELI